MSSQIIKSKLVIPSIRLNLVERKNLINKLNNGLHRKITLVSAPAGFGKTTLISSWVKQLEIPSAWLTLDEHDNNIPLFINYFTSAFESIYHKTLLRTKFENVEHGQSALASQMISIINSIIEESFPDGRQNQSFSKIEKPLRSVCDFVFVLDDYQVINSIPIHESINFLIQYLPPRVHLLILSRTDPPIPISKLRGRDQINEIRAKELRFSKEEITQFIGSVMNLKLTTEEISILEAKTEGWIAGLQMAGISLQGQENISLFFEEFISDNRYIFDYLAEEVLKKYSKEIYLFLLKSSILDYLSVDLCNMITERNDSLEILEMLERENLFVSTFGERKESFRYHALFSDMLQYILKKNHPEWIPVLHRKASSWYFQEGMVFEALNHLITINDTDAAAKLIAKSDLTFALGGEIPLLTYWLESLPEYSIQSRPRLLVFQIWMQLLEFNAIGMETYIRDALGQLGYPIDFYSQWPDEENPEIHSLLVEIASLTSFLETYKGNYDHALSITQKTMDHFQSKDVLMKASILEAQGDCYRDLGQIDKALEVSMQSLESFQKENFIRGDIVQRENIATLYLFQGEFQKAVSLFFEVISWGKTATKPFFSVCKAHIGLGKIYFLQNKPELSEKHLLRGVSDSELGGYNRIFINGAIELINVYLSQGKFERALILANQVAEKANLTGFASMKEYAETVMVLLWLHPDMNRLDFAADWGKDQLNIINDQVTLLNEYKCMVLSLVMQKLTKSFNLSDFEKVNELFSIYSKHARKHGRITSLINLLISQFVFERIMGKSTSYEFLLEAVRLAGKDFIIRPFLDSADWINPDEIRRISSDISSEFSFQLAEEIENHHQSKISSLTLSNNDISDRELDVIKLLEEGFPNRIIAQKLCISVGTVKKHLENIYLKLGVHNRTEAVNKARELKII